MDDLKLKIAEMINYILISLNGENVILNSTLQEIISVNIFSEIIKIFTIMFVIFIIREIYKKLIQQDYENKALKTENSSELEIWIELISIVGVVTIIIASILLYTSLNNLFMLIFYKKAFIFKFLLEQLKNLK